MNFCRKNNGSRLRPAYDQKRGGMFQTPFSFKRLNSIRLTDFNEIFTKINVRMYASFWYSLFKAVKGWLKIHTFVLYIDTAVKKKTLPHGAFCLFVTF